MDQVVQPAGQPPVLLLSGSQNSTAGDVYEPLLTVRLKKMRASKSQLAGCKYCRGSWAERKAAPSFKGKTERIDLYCQVHLRYIVTGECTERKNDKTLSAMGLKRDGRIFIWMFIIKGHFTVSFSRFR